MPEFEVILTRRKIIDQESRVLVEAKDEEEAGYIAYHERADEAEWETVNHRTEEQHIYSVTQIQ